MGLINQLCEFLKREQIFSPNENGRISISPWAGDASKHNDMLPRRYIVLKNSKPQLCVKFIPRAWIFSVEDIVRTQSLYSEFNYFKVAHLLGNFSNDEGHFLVEKYLSSPVALDLLVEKGDMNYQQVGEVIRKILWERWKIGKKPSEEFVQQEKRNSVLIYLNLTRRLILTTLLGTT